MAQDFIRTPLFAQLDGGALKVAVILFEFSLEAREQRESVGGRTGEPDDDLVVVEAAHLTRRRFHDSIAHSNLAVAGHGDMAGTAHEQHSRTAQTRDGIFSVHLCKARL